MEKLKTILNSYFWLIVGLGLGAIALAAFALSSSCETQKFNRTVSNQSIQSNTAVQEAMNANTTAANFDIERRTEDAVRSSVITPKLDAARRQSQQSKADLETAEKNLQNAKTNLSNLNRSISDNCVALQRLYPNTNFDYCSGR